MIGGPRVPTTVIPHNDGSKYAPTNDDKRQLKNLKLIYNSILAIEDKLTTPNINLDELSKSVGSFVPTITSSDLLEKVYPTLAQMFTIKFNNLKNASNVSLNKRYKLKKLNNYMTNGFNSKDKLNLSSSSYKWDYIQNRFDASSLLGKMVKMVDNDDNKIISMTVK